MRSQDVVRLYMGAGAELGADRKYHFCHRFPLRAPPLGETRPLIENLSGNWQIEMTADKLHYPRDTVKTSTDVDVVDVQQYRQFDGVHEACVRPY